MPDSRDFLEAALARALAELDGQKRFARELAERLAITSALLTWHANGRTGEKFRE